MNNSSNKPIVVIILAAIVALGLVGYLWYTSSGSGTVATSTPTTTPSDLPDPQTAGTGAVLLAMLDTAGDSNGPSRGCDKVAFVQQQIATTTAPLTAAMQALFAISTTSVNGWFNYIDRTNETLQFDHATVSNGTAHIYLTGSLSGLAGICDDPRTDIQIKETALQFATVQNVQLYLNNQAVATLAPSMK